MTQIEATYRLRIHERGTTDPDNSTVDFTLDASVLGRDLPSIPGPVARPLDGRTETQAWSLTVVDRNDMLTSRLADGGQMHLLGRLAEYQESRDGGSTWETLYTGRIAGLTETNHGRYEVRLADERWIERRARVFTEADTTSIWPAGIRYVWRGGLNVLARSQMPIFRVWAVESASRRVLLQVGNLDGVPLGGALTQSALDMIRGDRKDGAPDLNAGNYKTLRLWVHTLHPTPEVFDAQVIGFDTAGRFGVEHDPLRPLPSLDESLEAGQPIEHIWVRWPEDIDLPAAITHGALVHLYAPGHEPSETYPLHVGVQDASHPYGTADGGVHPFDLLERLYTEAGIRIDPVAFAALKADTSYRRGAWRITAPQQLAEWAERHIYRNTLVVPFIDNQGRISPKSLLPPPGLNPDTLFVFDASNTKEPYPTFDHQDGETVNSVGVEYGEENPVESVDPSDHDTLDRISVEQQTREPIRHFTVVQGYAPERQITLDLSGWQDAPLPKNRPDPITGIYIPPIMGTRHLGMASAHIDVALSVLSRWGDGPITQVIYGTEATREVQAGDWVIIDQDSLRGPNPATNARSGKRLVQVLKPDILPIGYRYEVLDAGPALQPLSTPSISVAQDPSDPRHSIRVTVSNTPQNATVTVEVAYDSGFQRIVHTLAGVGDGVHTIGPLASGTQVYVRAYSTAPGRIRSLSTATHTVTTQALSAPTNAAATASGRTIRLDWTPGEAGYALMPTLDGDDALPSPLPAGSTTYVFTGLEPATQYTVGVKHVDPYGGESAIASDTETTGASTQLAAPRRLWVRQGRTDPAQPGGGFLGELIARMRTGLEVQFVPGEPQASHRLQAATDAAFNEVIVEVPIRPGVDRVRFPTALRADLVYVRIRAERDGYTESDWSEVVSAYPTVLQDETPDSDMLPGGWATARIDEAGKVWLDIGSDDPDTERAYYTVNTTAYTEPNTGSTHVNRSAMPAAIDTGLTLQYGQTAYIWVRFWGGGVFGQATRLAITRTADALAPSIQADPVQSGSTGTLTLTINDPGRRVQEVQYQIRQGGGSFGGTWLNTWDSSTGTPGTDATLIRTKSVTLVKGHNSEIKWRIAWTDAAGNVRVHIDSHAFDSDTTADVQGVQVSFNDAGQVVVSAIGDEDTTAMYVTAAVGSDPSDPTTSSTSIAARHGTVTLTSVTVAPGQTAHVKVRGRNAAGQLGPVRLVRVPNSVVGTGPVPPRALLRILEYTDLLDAIVQITGAPGAPGSPAPTQYRWREYREGSTPGSYSDWLPLDGNRQATVTVARRPKGNQIVEAQVRTAAGLESDPVTVAVEPVVPGIDDTTGKPKWSELLDDNGGQMALVNEAASKGQNLLGPDAGPERVASGGFLHYLGNNPGTSLTTLGLAAGQVVSGRISLKSDTGADRLALGVVFFDQGGAVISTHEGTAVQASDYAEAVVEGVTIPEGAASMTFRARNLDTTETWRARHAMLNRGPVALPFEAPPLRPNRETLADVSGPLREGTGMLEGQVVHQLFRHGEIIIVSGSPSGEMDVPFGQAYEDAPAVSLAGLRCITFKDDPTFPGDQRLMIQAEVDEDSVKSVAKLISVSGTVTRQSNNFPLGNALIALGAATEVTLTPAGAIGGIYVVHYSVSVTAFPITEAPRNSINVKVAIETWHGSAWIERAVYTYSAATSGPQQTNTWPHEQKQIIASNLAAGNKIRLVIKDVTTQGDGGGFTVHGFDGVGDPADGVTYETAATAEMAISAIPSAADYVKWLVQAIS